MGKIIGKRSLAVLLAMLMIGSVFSEYPVSAQASKAAQNTAVNETGGQSVAEGQDASGGSLPGDQEGFTVTKFEIKVDGKTLEEGAEVYAGAEVEVSFEWALEDSVEAPSPWKDQTYTIDTNSGGFKNSGIDFSQMEFGTPENPMDLRQAGDIVGKYYMQDGVIYIIITSEDVFNHQHSRYGGVFFKGKIAKDPDKTHDGQKKKIEFGTQSTEVTYYDSDKPSEAYVWKIPNGKISYKDGKYYQTFLAGVKTSNGKVTKITLQDTVSPTDGLKNVQDCKITKSSVAGLSVDTSYSSLEELFAAIGSATFYAGDEVEFEYTMEVSPDILKADQDTYSNTIDGTYQCNRDSGQHKMQPAKADVQVNRPSISKNASGYEDGKVSWTITVNLGDLYEEGKDKLSDYLSSITDIPGVGLLNQDTRVSLSFDAFEPTPGKPWEFTYTYETAVTDEVKNSPSDETVQNSVEMVIGGSTFTDSKSYTVENNAVKLEKSAIGMSEKDGQQIITWSIVVSGITVGVKELQLSDFVDVWNGDEDHALVDYVWVDNKEVRDENGFKNNDDPVILIEKDTKIDTTYNNLTLVFDDDYVKSKAEEKNESDRKIEVRIKTRLLKSAKDDQGGLREFINKVSGSYTSDSSGTTQRWGEKQAVYADTSNLVTKTGMTHAEEPEPNQNIRGHEVEYTIKVPLQYLDIQANGEEFAINDVLDSRMKLVNGTVSVKLEDKWGNEKYRFIEDSQYNLTTSGDNSGDSRAQKLIFTIPVTSDLKTIMDEAHDSEWLLVIHYKAEYKDVAALLRDGEAVDDVTNTAGGTYDGKSIGSSSVTKDLEPDSIITKSAQYNQATAPYIKYTVEVNQEGLTLLTDGGKLYAEDSLDKNSALILVDVENKRFNLDEDGKEKYRVRVYEVGAVENSWEEPQVTELGTSEYSYRFDGERKLILELPDGKHLKIEYYGYTVAEPGSIMDAGNSTNTFKLSGFASEAAEGSHAFDNQTVENYGWVASLPGSITLYKYWQDKNSGQVALNGSVFRIVDMNYDEQSGEWKEGNVRKDNICVTEDNKIAEGKIQIDGLPVKQLMALYEIEAEDGYAVNKKPYYFYIKGKDEVAIPTNLPAGTKEFEEDLVNEVDYPNYLEAILQLEKTIEGGVTREEAEGALKFTVKDSDGELIRTYYLTDFDYDTGSGKWTKTIDGLSPGVYTVEETVYDTAGHKVTSVKYSLDNGGTWSSSQAGKKDTTAQVELEEGETATVTYKNIYPGSHPVVISKRALGGEEEIEGATLEITGTKADGTPIDTIRWTTEKDATKDKVEPYEVALEPGEYTLTEIIAPKGYQIAPKITFTVDQDGNVKVTSTAGDLDGTTVIMEDDLLDVEVDKYKSDSDEKLKDAKLELYDSEALDDNYELKDGSQVLATWESTEDGEPWSIGEWLYAGQARTYVLIERIAPKGYGYANIIKFKVDADGRIFEVINVNEAKDLLNTTKDTPGNKIIMRDSSIDISLRKVDHKGAWVAGATIKVYRAEDMNGDEPKDGAQLVCSWRTEDRAVSFGEHLSANEDGTDREYVIVEDDDGVPDGYQKADPIHIFVKSDGTVTNEKGQPITSIDMVDVAKDAEVATMIIKKTISGKLTPGEVKGGLMFHVQGVGGAAASSEYKDGKTFKIEDFKSVGDNEYALTLYPVELGTYKVWETVEDPNGVKHTTTYTITVNGDNSETDVEMDPDKKVDIELLEKGDVVTVAYENKYQYETGTIKLIKSFTSSGDTLNWNDIKEKLNFTVYEGDVSDGKEVATVLGTDSGWKQGDDRYHWVYEMENVRVGESYTVVEKIISDIDDYDMTTTYTVTVENSQSSDTDSGDTAPNVKVEVDKETTVEFSNDYVRTYPVLISKRDINGGTAELPGAELTVSADDDETEDGSEFKPITWTSGEEPHKLSLKPGIYTLTETTAPKGFKKTESIRFRVEENGTITILDNDPTGKLDDFTVIMQDAGLDVEVDKVVLTDGSQEVAGAKLELYVYDEQDEEWKYITYDISKPNESWQIGGYLQLGGRYKLVETSAPDGYGYSEAIEFTVDENGNIKDVKYADGGTDVSTIGNKILMQDKVISVSLRKVDDTLQMNPVAGAEISVYRADDIINGEPIADAKWVHRWPTTSDGEVESFGFKLQADVDYVIMETDTPKGYKTADPIYIRVKPDGTVVQIINGAEQSISGYIEMVDEEAASLVIEKTIKGGLTLDEIDGGLTFEVKGPGYSEVFTIKEHFKEVGDNKYRLELQVKPGTYTVTEKVETDGVKCSISYTMTMNGTPDGTGESQDGKELGTGNITLEKGDEVVVAYENNYEIIKGKIKLRKSFASSGDQLTWAEIAPTLTFRIYEGSDLKNTVFGAAQGWEPVVGETNQYEYVLDEVKIGKSYKVVEECDAIGDYVRVTTYMVEAEDSAGPGTAASGTEASNVEVEDGKTTTVTYNNTYVDPVYISKKDITNQEEVPGAELAVSGRADDDTEFSDSWTSGKEPHKLQLKPGSYKLTETIAPRGYAKADEITFEVNGEGDISITSDQENSLHGSTITMWDAPLTLKLNKMALVTNENGSVPADETKVGQSLAHAIIEIYEANPDNSKGELVASWESDGTTTPHDFGPDLFADKRYILIETQAPQGYSKISEEIIFTIDKDGTVKIEKAPKNNYYQDSSDGVIYILDEESDEPLVSLVLTKSIEGVDYAGADELLNGKLTFTVECISGDTGYEEPLIFTVGGEGFHGLEWDNDEQKFIRHVTNLKPGTYVVTESWLDSDFIVCQEQSYTVVITKASGQTMTSQPSQNNGKEGKKFDTNSFGLEDGDKAEVNFTNTYETRGTLIIRKTFEGDITEDEVNGSLRFTVTNNGTGDEETYTLKEDFYHVDGTKYWEMELIEVTGGYTVKESVTNPNGKTYTATYQVNGGEEKDSNKDGDTVQVSPDSPTTVQYMNKYGGETLGDNNPGGGGNNGSDESGSTGGDSGGSNNKKTTKKKNNDDDNDDTPVLMQVANAVVTSLTQTGDGAPLGIWLLLLVCGGAGVIAGAIALKRRRKRD